MSEVEERRLYFFTLASNQGGPGCVQVEASSWSEARDKMFASHYGKRWAFQYERIENVHELDRKIIEIL